MADSAREFVTGRLWLLIAIVTLPLTILTDLAVGEPFAGAVFVTGYFLLVPLLLFFGDEIAGLLFGDPEDDGESDREDPLSELKARYARGEIDEAEFERRAERLLETEGVARAGASRDELDGGRTGLGDGALDEAGSGTRSVRDADSPDAAADRSRETERER